LELDENRLYFVRSLLFFVAFVSFCLNQNGEQKQMGLREKTDTGKERHKEI